MNAPRALRRALFPALVLAALVASCGEEAPLSIDWGTTTPVSGTVVGDVVEVTAGPAGGRFVLTTIVDPPVGGTGYAVTGDVRYEDVTGQGFLEMWSFFEGDGAYFSRTLDTAGPLAALSGSSPPRAFALPFLLEGAPAAPEALEIAVVLPGAGTVAVGPLTLGPLDGVTSTTGVWWTDSTGGLIGGIGGSVVGVLAALGVWLVARGRRRDAVLGAMWVGLGAGIVTFAVGLYAVVDGQGYGVYYPLLLLGGLLALVCGLGYPVIRRRYEAVELRRMHALDAA